MLYRGASDLEVAKELGISKEEWLEVRKVCSGPPLELKEQAQPTEPLEASEINFADIYLQMASSALDEVSKENKNTLDKMEVYLCGTGNRIPVETVNALLDACGCHTTDWSTVDLELQEGIVELGNGRVQGSLF